MHMAEGGMHRGGGGMHVHPVHPPWVRPWLLGYEKKDRTAEVVLILKFINQ
jgi:hypothetical protein